VSAPETITNPYLAALLPALKRLDRLLDWAVAAMQPVRGSEPSAPFRGLYISREDVACLLAQQPGESPFREDRRSHADAEARAEEHSALAWMIRAFELSSFDAEVILLARRNSICATRESMRTCRMTLREDGRQ
jgi:hypothetical protein